LVELRPGQHLGGRSGWLRAAVLGADDGIVTTASIALGVSAASASYSGIVTAGVAALVAGSFSMAVGEYVSVSSQRDGERATVAVERRELATDPEGEAGELAKIYEERGLSRALAARVAAELMARDPLAAHVRDELGLTSELAARPLQAALSSAFSFAFGSCVPLFVIIIAPRAFLEWLVAAAALLSLASLGWISARLGGGHPVRAILRVTIGGGLAMAATLGVGSALSVSGF
jgi:VIT1/CCC1 family predicted Fe2+/Mn2+ transporter